MTGYHYPLYGLTLRTNRPLPELEPLSSVGDADVVAELAGADAGASAPAIPAPWLPVQPPVPVWRAHTREGAYHRLRYAGAGHELEFILDPCGRRVWATWNERVALADVSALLLGPIFSCVLRRRARTCLHASVVAIDGRAVALLGAKGAGKSTTALALVRAGATFIADDVAVLDESGGDFGVRSGPAMLRMRAAPAEALCGSYDGLRAMWSQADDRPAKRYLDVGAGEAASGSAAYPLAAIYFLGPRDASEMSVTVAPFDRAAALPLLLAHRHMSLVVEPEGHATDFGRLVRLTARVPVRRVLRPEGLDAIAAIAEAIADDVRASG